MNEDIKQHVCVDNTLKVKLRTNTGAIMYFVVDRADVSNVDAFKTVCHATVEGTVPSRKVVIKTGPRHTIEQEASVYHYVKVCMEKGLAKGLHVANVVAVGDLFGFVLFTRKKRRRANDSHEHRMELRMKTAKRQQSEWIPKHVIVTDSLFSSVDLLFDKYRPFSKGTVFFLAAEMLSQIGHFHSLGLVHGDIKPDNFVISIQDKKTIMYIIDFGLSSQYMSPELHHIEEGLPAAATEVTPFFGTSRYASIRSHGSRSEGGSYSRRDDLESFLYSIMFLFHQTLPWQTCLAHDIATQKKDGGRNLACIMGSTFTDLYDDIMQLAFSETINYQNWCVKLFSQSRWHSQQEPDDAYLPWTNDDSDDSDNHSHC